MRYLILLLLSFNVYGADWSTEDTWRETGWQAINYIDYLQTSNISESHYEQNPALGKHPSQGEIDKYFLVSAASHYGISELLPSSYRRVWQWLTIGFSSAIVYHNYEIGLKVSF